jgi:23S rRNA (cytosine1962-C5)-methyltransferase
LVELFDHQDQRIGTGFFQPNASLRIRLLSFGAEFAELDREFFIRRFSASRALREERLKLWREDNQAYRLCNAEGDGLGGLFVDVFGERLSVQLSTFGMLRRVDAIVEALAHLWPERPLQLSANREAQKMERWPKEALSRLETANSEQPHAFIEEGVRYLLPTGQGQKTGHYLDQRVNRRRFQDLASGDVLDAHCYTGGFALHAAKAGARVLAVDASERAIQQLALNAGLNGVPMCELGARGPGIQARAAAVESVLVQCQSESRLFDVINLDPPKLAPRMAHVEKALSMLDRLLELALAVLRPGGLLCLSSCSQGIELESMARRVAMVAGRMQRTSLLLEQAGQPADHPTPAALREARYLSFGVFLID